MKNVNRKMLIAGLACIVLLGVFGGGYYYNENVKEYELYLNGKVYFKGNKQEISSKSKEVLEKEISSFVEKKREEVLALEIELTEIPFLEDNEEIIRKKVDEYHMEVTVIHTIPTEIVEEIPFEKETKSDDNQYKDYSKITTAGENGFNKTSYTSVYKNGVLDKKVDEVNESKDPINEITTVGTKTRPASSYASGGGSSSGGSGGSSSGSRCLVWIGNYGNPVQKLYEPSTQNLYNLDGSLYMNDGGWGNFSC